ncbi:BRO family protein [Priestia megaterium]
MYVNVIAEKNLFEYDFKVYGTKDEPLFLAKDVAELIDYSYANKAKGTRKVSQMLRTIDDDEKVKGRINVVTQTVDVCSVVTQTVDVCSVVTQTTDTNNVVTQNKRGGLNNGTDRWFITENGLYELLMQSRKPIAKQFKKEVKDILKQIRLTGGYIPIAQDESIEEILAKGLLVAEETLKIK